MYHVQMLRAYKGVLPRIHPSAYVDETAQVIGDVEIGEASSVWMNVVVRGDVHRIRIGSRTNLQDGTIVHVMRGTHPTTIGDEVTIGHAAVVHGCTLHDRVLIGMGAILLNGVEVGADSIVAAGTLMPEGARIPPRSLVMGSPGKVRRDLTREEIDSIRDYAERYVAYRLDYMPISAGSGPST
ncbi:MAG: gamma carbonic anhydrase family protein [Acidobacteria bacterium RIFCSPLOWO2_02_FULL_67_36]|nr:MAG: gamma carbonic anhydrase family protein [Acidobacteria bacterium RIFCSPLOWO2_02_FULL_67_36]OFW21063.1 MAG: gamma carbonic anhydrase family protein [Acidobacteria bacterium RIFCSPLOWO2_12_FULL_66_21]